MNVDIIGLLGVAGSGKDTAADFLVKNHGFVKVALADPLKRICKDVYDFSDEQLWGPSEMRNAEDPRYPRVLSGSKFDDGEPRRLVHSAEDPTPVCLTPRYALQQLGTEWGRDCYDNTWIDLALRTAKKLMEPPVWDTARNTHLVSRYSAQRGLIEAVGTSYKGVVIPDCRFKNEVKAIREARGMVVRLNRPGSGLSGAAGQHRSEKEQEGIKDLSLLNNRGSLEDLEKEVRLMVEWTQRE